MAGRIQARAIKRCGELLKQIEKAQGANQTNGLRRMIADKRRCVEIALHEFSDWSDRRIGEVCGVNDTTVASRRLRVQESCTCHNSAQPEPSTRTGKDGKQYPACPDPAGGGAEERAGFPVGR